MKKQPKKPITITLAFAKEAGAGERYVVLELPKPVQSTKQLFRLIIKNPV